MSSVPGIVPTVKNDLVSSGAPPGKAIGLVGQRNMIDATVSSGVRAYDATTRGAVYNLTSLGDWIALLGTMSTATWTDGDQHDLGVTAAVSPHSQKDSILYALALIYSANPSANVFATILDGNATPTTDTSIMPTGGQAALDDLLLYDDIAYVVIAGVDPIAAGKSHAETATISQDPAYNMPRFYVTGMDLFKAWDTETVAGAGAPLSDDDVARWSPVQSDYGVVLAYLGNHDFNFGAIGDTDATGSGITRQIGGQLAAAHYAGFLSSRSESIGVTYLTNSLGAVKFTKEYNDTDSIDYIFSLSELNYGITNGWMITRFVQNSYVYAKGITFHSEAGTNWKLYPHRAITNYIHKTLADNLLQFLGKQQVSSTLMGAQKLAEGLLGDAVARSFISTYSVRVSAHPTEVDAIIAAVQFTTVKPINKIYLNITVN